MEPKVRFKGFKGEWKETTLSDICIVNPKDELPHSFEYVDLESVLGTNLISHRTEYKETSPSRAQRVAEFGDIFFQSVRPYQRNNYLFTKNDANYVFSSGYVQLRTFEDNGFIFAIIQTDSFVNEVLCKCAGSSYPTISSKDLSHIPFRITKSKEEQHAIASFFRTLDAELQASAKKVESLKKLKSASLVAMFPQNGESTPKVRFKGFEGKWEKTVLSDCLDISYLRNSENLFDKEDVLSVSDDFGVMNQIELLGRSYAGKNVSGYRVLQKGEIVYTKSPLKDKPFGIIKMNSYQTGIVSVLYGIYRVKDNTCADYIHYYFDPAWRLNSYMRPLVNKGAKNTMNISDDTALMDSIQLPSKSEQQAIASFFRSLDRKIALETARLEKLKQIKLACLDKMFV